MIGAARNLGAKALRRLYAARKPFIRSMRRGARGREAVACAAEAAAVEREIAAVASGSSPIIAGPWLAEVGYEALYWVPFIRWFKDAYRIPADRITVVSRGGVESWYRDITTQYIDIFDHLAPAELAAGNEERQLREEGGGRKQSAPSALDARILAFVQDRTTHHQPSVLHPSLMFRLFRHVWHGSLPLDFFWTHTDYALLDRPPRPAVAGLPADYIAAKFYTGTAVPDTPAIREMLRAIVRHATSIAPVVTLDTGVSLDDHDDYLFEGIPDVISARPWMTARHNLGVQTALAAHAHTFIGTCGGLAWLAPFFGVPAVGVYADDRQLATHLLTARHATRRAGAADLSLLDLRALDRAGLVHPILIPAETRSRVEGDRRA